MTIRLSILLAVLMIVAGLALSARPAVAQATDAAGAEAAADGEAPAAPVADQDDEDEDDEEQEKAERAEAFRNVVEQSRDYLVTVATRWKKDNGELPDGGYGYGYRYRVSVSGLVDNKESSEEAGVMADPAEGLVVAVDHGKETRFIESVKGYTAAGQEFPLERYGFYLDMDAALYKTDKWPGKKEGLAWLEGPLDVWGGGGLASGLSRQRGGWQIAVQAGGGNGGQLIQATDWTDPGELVARGGFGLCFDGDARPIGFATGSYVSLVGDRYPWRGADLKDRKIMTFEAFDKLKAGIEQQVDQYAHEVLITYRQPEGEEENLEFAGEDRDSMTQHYFGYAVSPTRIFVPVKLQKIYIQRFKEIKVRIDGKDVPATFLGAFLEFGGFLVEMEGGTSPAVLPIDKAAPVPEFNRAVVTYKHERKFGKRRNIVWYNRFQDYVRGYKDRLWPEVKSSMDLGTLVLDFEGRPICMRIIERKIEQEKKGTSRYYYYGRDEGNERLYHVSQLAEALARPDDHFDPNLKPTSQQEERRLVWLGVETQGISPMLAEMLDEINHGGQIQKLTRKGAVGLRVVYVYKNSPAAKAGLAVGDILLEVKEEGKDEPIELEGGGGGGRYSYDMWDDWGGGGGYTEIDPVSSRSNYLTGLLTRLGPGTKINLAYLRGAEKLSQDFTLEFSPYDFASADKYKDEKTGLTVKNLTYDVLAVLRLEDNQPGVIVAKVEDGEKAAIAQIFSHHIITDINGQPVKSVEDYKKIMTAIQETEGGGTAVFTLLWMGKSHMIKIQFP